MDVEIPNTNVIVDFEGPSKMKYLLKNIRKYYKYN